MAQKGGQGAMWALRPRGGAQARSRGDTGRRGRWRKHRRAQEGLKRGTTQRRTGRRGTDSSRTRCGGDLWTLFAQHLSGGKHTNTNITLKESTGSSHENICFSELFFQMDLVHTWFSLLSTTKFNIKFDYLVCCNMCGL